MPAAIVLFAGILALAPRFRPPCAVGVVVAVLGLAALIRCSAMSTAAAGMYMRTILYRLATDQPIAEIGVDMGSVLRSYLIDRLAIPRRPAFGLAARRLSRRSSWHLSDQSLPDVVAQATRPAETWSVLLRRGADGDVPIAPTVFEGRPLRRAVNPLALSARRSDARRGKVRVRPVRR